MKREPHHFSYADLGKAMLGSFVFALTFLFKGSMVSFAKQMQVSHVIAVIIATFLIVTIEIYILSYRFVKNRQERPFYEFWAKRFFAIVISSVIVICAVIYIYGVNAMLTAPEMVKLVSAIFMPAAIGGAAVEVLKKR